MSSSTSSSESGSLRGLVLAFASVVVLGVGVVVATTWDAAVQAGRVVLDHRQAAFVDPQRERDDVPLAVFLGDSTFLPGYAYPRLLARKLGKIAEIQLFWWEGFEPFHHYLLAGRTMRLAPDVVVIVAQTRVFWRHEPLWYPDLLTLLPPAELPRAIRLPFHERGVTVPRVVMASLLGSLGASGEAGLLAFEGLRRVAGRTPGLGWLVPVRAGSADPRMLSKLRHLRFERYGMPVYPGHPAVQALGATVEQTVRGGAKTLVLVSPIPVERLREAGLYDAAVFARRVAVLEEAVEGEGGTLLDLHAILEGADFSDEFGHMTESGARKVALVLETWLRRALTADAR